MQTESNEKPSQNFIMENYINNNVDIVFFDDVKEVTKEIHNQDGIKENTIVYEYNTYRITQRYRNTLEDDIRKNYSKYLEKAKKKEIKNLANEIRKRRDKLLVETDKYLLDDFPISPEEKEKYKIYRNALREVPEQQGFPYCVSWPSL